MRPLFRLFFTISANLVTLRTCFKGSQMCPLFKSIIRTSTIVFFLKLRCESLSDNYNCFSKIGEAKKSLCRASKPLHVRRPGQNIDIFPILG